MAYVATRAVSSAKAWLLNGKKQILPAFLLFESWILSWLMVSATCAPSPPLPFESTVCHQDPASALQGAASWACMWTDITSWEHFPHHGLGTGQDACGETRCSSSWEPHKAGTADSFMGDQNKASVATAKTHDSVACPPSATRQRANLLTPVWQVGIYRFLLRW